MEFVRVLSENDLYKPLYPRADNVFDTIYLGLETSFIKGDSTLTVGSEGETLNVILSIPGENYQYIDTYCDHQEALKYAEQLIASSK